MKKIEKNTKFHVNQDPHTKKNTYVLRGDNAAACFLPCDLAGEVPLDVDLLLLNGCDPNGEQKLGRILETHPGITIAGTSTILAFVRELLGKGFPQKALKEGDIIDLGDALIRCLQVPNIKRSRHQNRTWRKAYRFLQVPNWQWMDGLYFYVPGEKALLSGQTFSQNAAGMHAYFREHIRPFQTQMAKALPLIETLDIELFYPEMGNPVAFDEGIGNYKQWIDNQKKHEKGLKLVKIPYYSVYGATEKLAERVAAGIAENPGVKAELLNVDGLEPKAAAESLLEADGIAFGIPTMQEDGAVPLRRIMAEMSAVLFKGKLGMAFGSFSYEAHGVKNAMERMDQLGMRVFGEGLSVRFRPDEEQLGQAELMGSRFGKCVAENELLPFVEPSKEESTAAIVATDRIFLIIGNGAAGTTAAEQIRKLDSGCKIEILTKEPHFGYNRQMMTKGILKEIQMRNMMLHNAQWYEDNQIDTEVNVSVERIDYERRQALLSTGAIRKYDRLILATGAAPHIPEMPGMEKSGVFSLHHLDEVDAMRAYIRKNDIKHILILGGGILGLETAAELYGAGFSLTIADRAPILMEKQLDQRAGVLLAEQVEACGIHVLTSVALTEILGTERMEGVRLADGNCLKAELLILCTGIHPNGHLINAAGSIAVNEKMETGMPDTYACGDCASFQGVNLGLWTQATEMARVAAINAVGGNARYGQTIPAVAFAGLGISLFSIGETGNPSEAAYDSKEVFLPENRIYKKLYFKGGRFCGGILMGDVDSAAELVTAYREKTGFDALKL